MAASEKSMNLQKNKRMLEEGSFGELLLKLCLPAVVVILIMIIYNMADTYFIGQTNDPNKISAISICMPIFGFLSGLGTLFGIGGGTSISIALGEKNEEKIKHITAFCGFGSVTLGIVISIILFVFAEPIVYMLGGNEDIIESALMYLKVFAFACPFVIFSNAYGSILRSDGGAALAMVANIAGTLFNIVGDAFFILILHWDVFGAALATVLGNILSVVLVFIIMIKKKQLFMPSMKNLLLKSEIVVPVLTLGLPMTFSTTLNSVSSTIQNRLMIEHGSVCLAAQSVAGKFGMLISMLIMGFCMGNQPAISFNYGGKNYKRMNQIVRQMGIFSSMVGLFMAAFIFIFKDAAIAAFIEDEAVISYGRVFVLASVSVGPIYGIYQTCQTFLQATGKAKSAIIVSLLDKGLVFIPVLLIMNRFLGAYGIAFSHAVTLAFSVVFALGMVLLPRKD